MRGTNRKSDAIVFSDFRDGAFVHTYRKGVIMKRRLLQVLAMCSALVSATASAETLAEYVDACKSDLGIGTALPALNCNNGLLFAPNHGGQDKTSDKVGYSRITDTVDLVFACRWFFQNGPQRVSVLA